MTTVGILAILYSLDRNGMPTVQQFKHRSAELVSQSWLPRATYLNPYAIRADSDTCG